MNKKGQTAGIIIGIAITLIVAIILFQSIAQYVGQTSEVSDVNVTAYTPPASGLTVTLTGQELIGGYVAVNQSGTYDCSLNYTVAEGVSTTTGTKRVLMTAATSDLTFCPTINYSYTYGAEGYIDSSGGRAIAAIIVIFTALAIAVVALLPSLRSGVVEFMGRK